MGESGYGLGMAMSVWGPNPGFPRRVLDAVSAHAKELGRGVASDDLFLLALTGVDASRPARCALEQEGIDADLLLTKIRTGGDRASDAPRALMFAPAYYSVQGRAQGFAAALGTGKITPEAVLLAVLWDPNSHSSQLLWRLGVKRERIVERLRDLGVAVPPAPVPPQHPVEYGEKVWFERRDVGPVIRQLQQHIPPGTRWGFNYEEDRAWAFAEASVDLEELVNTAVAESRTREET